MNLPTEVRYRPYADWTDEEKTKIRENVAKSPWRASGMLTHYFICKHKQQTPLTKCTITYIQFLG